MQICLDQNIFHQDPYNKFADEYGVKRKFWVDVFHTRYKLYHYEIDVLTEYVSLKLKKKISDRTIRRWVSRTEIYNRAQIAIGKGAEIVTDEYFEGLSINEFINKDLIKCH